MPGAKRTASSRALTVSKAKKGRYAPSRRMSVARPIKSYFGKQPFPKQLYNRLKYAEKVDVTLNASGLGSYIFSCNSLYDPNASPGGHQPLYFDQLTGIYDHYTVLKSRMKMTVVSTGDYPVIVSLGQDDDTTIAVANAYTMWERTGTTNKVVNLAIQPNSTALYSYWNAKSVFGGDPQAQDSLQGSATTNPSEQTYYVCYFDAGVAGTGATITIMVEILYDTVWDEYVSIASS